jgi:hypothetical protein
MRRRKSWLLSCGGGRMVTSAFIQGIKTFSLSSGGSFRKIFGVAIGCGMRLFLIVRRWVITLAMVFGCSYIRS